MTLLTRADEIARRSNDSSLIASLATHQAGTLMAAFRYEEAIARAEEALGLLAPWDTRLELLARSVLTESLVFLRRPPEALRSLIATLPLFEQLRGLRTDLLQGYLEALLLDSLGFAREAERAFRSNIAGRMEAEHYKDAFLTMLTYFDSLVHRGMPDKAARACEEALAMTERSGSALAADTGHVGEALEVLRHAELICRRLRDSITAASIRVQAAGTLMAGFRFEEAIARAEVALRAMPSGETRL